MNRGPINPLQWHSAVGVARQVCARVFSDGRTPADAVVAFGLTPGDAAAMTWSKAVEVIAERLCQRELRRAA